jgi:Tfp pilus assembly protein PilF
MLYKNDKFEKAQEIVHAAIQQYELQGVFIEPDVYEHLGMISEKLGNTEQAKEAFRQALDAGGKDLTEADRNRIKAQFDRLN